MSLTGLIFDSFVTKHDTGLGHPEQAARALVVYDAVRKANLPGLEIITPQPAGFEQLSMVHEERYIELVQREVAAGYGELSTGDVTISRDSYEAALRAAGAVCTGVDAVLGKTLSNAFCVARPPGHHAGPQRGMGFCLFNNVAIGARYAQRRYGIERVAIVDWDVHHGNGTQDVFYEDGSVLFFSTHQSPWYPGTGARNERGRGVAQDLIINCPLPAESGIFEIGDAFHQLLVPALDHFKPELILISAGFDSRVNDPLGHFTLRDHDFVDLTNMLLDAADRHSGGRLISVLEGGYNLAGLASAAAAHVEALTGRHPEKCAAT